MLSLVCSHKALKSHELRATFIELLLYWSGNESKFARPMESGRNEDRKGGEGKTDANLTIFLSTFPAGHILLQVFIFVASRLSAWTLVRRAMVAPARAPANAPTAMLNRFISILTSVGSHRRVGAALVQVPEVFAAQKLDADFLGVCQVCAAIPPGPLPERNLKSLQREQLLDILLRAADFSRHLRQGPRLAASISVQVAGKSRAAPARSRHERNI